MAIDKPDDEKLAPEGEKIDEGRRSFLKKTAKVFGGAVVSSWAIDAIAKDAKDAKDAKNPPPPPPEKIETNIKKRVIPDPKIAPYDSLAAPERPNLFPCDEIQGEKEIQTSSVVASVAYCLQDGLENMLKEHKADSKKFPEIKKLAEMFQSAGDEGQYTRYMEMYNGSLELNQAIVTTLPPLSEKAKAIFGKIKGLVQKEKALGTSSGRCAEKNTLFCAKAQPKDISPSTFFPPNANYDPYKEIGNLAPIPLICGEGTPAPVKKGDGKISNPTIYYATLLESQVQAYLQVAVQREQAYILLEYKISGLDSGGPLNTALMAGFDAEMIERTKRIKGKDVALKPQLTAIINREKKGHTEILKTWQEVYLLVSSLQKAVSDVMPDLMSKAQSIRRCMAVCQDGKLRNSTSTGKCEGEK